jgi:hypothetical protein
LLSIEDRRGEAEGEVGWGQRASIVQRDKGSTIQGFFNLDENGAKFLFRHAGEHQSGAKGILDQSDETLIESSVPRCVRGRVGPDVHEIGVGDEGRVPIRTDVVWLSTATEETTQSETSVMGGERHLEFQVNRACHSARHQQDVALLSVKVEGTDVIQAGLGEWTTRRGSPSWERTFGRSERCPHHAKTLAAGRLEDALHASLRSDEIVRSGELGQDCSAARMAQTDMAIQNEETKQGGFGGQEGKQLAPTKAGSGEYEVAIRGEDWA